MNTFINYFFKLNGNLFISQELAETLATLCLPVFFTKDFPVEQRTWESVTEYAPFIFRMKKKEIDKTIDTYLNKESPGAWYRGMFNEKLREEFT